MHPSSFIPATFVVCFFLVNISNACFPPVDLGYAVHVPTSVNSTPAGWEFAEYNNIRFAHPPLGDLRFRKPKTPPPKQDGIQDGVAPPFSRMCVGAAPAELTSLPGLNGTAWGNEDCLFLNVRVPEGIKPGEKVPVLHWLYGGAYGLGAKDFFGDSIGLYNDLYPPGQKFINVASNYRLGLYGWASSPTEDMDANVGLHDGRAALEWTKKYISRFGGDPEQITVVGASAGAGIAALMLYGNGGEGELPFQKAFLSSPGFLPRRDPAGRQDVYDRVLKATDCDSISCLRDVSEETLFEANKNLIVNTSGKGSDGATLGPGIGFGPVVDGDYVPDLLPVLAKECRFNKGVQEVVSGNMAYEGKDLVFNELEMPAQFPEIVREVLPTADDETVRRIQSVYQYPPDQPQKLAWDWRTDTGFACNAYNVAQSYRDRTKRYFMSLPPAIHSQDFLYYFYINKEISPVENIELARKFQEYLRRFVTGSNNTDAFPDLKPWPAYGDDETSFDLTLDGFEVQGDPWGELSRRCEVLNEAISDPKNGA